MRYEESVLRRVVFAALSRELQDKDIVCLLDGLPEGSYDPIAMTGIIGLFKEANSFHVRAALVRLLRRAVVPTDYDLAWMKQDLKCQRWSKYSMELVHTLFFFGEGESVEKIILSKKALGNLWLRIELSDLLKHLSYSGEIYKRLQE